MITIDQLLESVDLDFEPRWVTKDRNGDVYIFEDTPEIYKTSEQWVTTVPVSGLAGYEGLKLAEFENKNWTECIYEVPRKADEYEQNLEKTRPADSDLVYRVNLPRKTTGKIEKIHIPDMDEVAESAMYSKELAKRLNQVIDAVNELKGAKND